MTDPVSPPTPAVVVPRFGDIVENRWASEDNPTRRGFFVRKFTRTGRVNAGLTWEITDGKGKFWTIQPRHVAEDDRLSVFPATPVPGDGRGEPFMYAYRCVDEADRWQAYRTQLRRGDGSICPGVPLYRAENTAPVPVEPRPSAGADGSERTDVVKIKEYVSRGPEDLGLGEVEALLEIAQRLALRSNPPAETAEAVANYRLAEDGDGNLQIYYADYSARVATFAKGVPEVERRSIAAALAQPAPQPVAGEDVERLREALREARWYVNDHMEAQPHDDGRDLLAKIDEVLP